MEIIACLEIEKKHDGDLTVQCALLHDVIENTDIPNAAVETGKIKPYREEAIEIHRMLHVASDYLSQRLAHKIHAYELYV